MSATTRHRLVNPRLGAYFGIFASAYISLVVLLMIFEELQTPPDALRWAMLIGPVLLYAAIGCASASDEGIEYFASGRRVPAMFNGLAMATAAMGGTGLVALTGAFFLNGFDAWCIAIGLVAGFVVMAILIAPYFRKFGSFTVASYLGRRFDSRMLRTVAALVLIGLMLLVLVAEYRIGIFVIRWLTGISDLAAAGFVAFAVVITVVLGGMRSLTWSSVAQSIAMMLALLVPVAIVASIVTNLPVAQFSYGPVLRGIGRTEAALSVPVPELSGFSYELARNALEPVARRFATPFGSIGPVAFIAVGLTVMAGVATAPWLLPRAGTTPGVYETRKSLGWAAVFIGIITLTLSAVAVFLRDIVLDTLVGRSAEQVPAWFQSLAGLQLAAIDGRVPNLPMSAFSFHRDATLFSLPLAAGFPPMILYVALSGAVAAVLLAIGALAVTLGHTVADDLVHGWQAEPPETTTRLATARIAIAGATLIAAALALSWPADPLQLLLWALSISGAAVFPVIVLSIWWKRLGTVGCMVGLVAGAAITVAAIAAAEMGLLGFNSALAGALGIPAGFAAALLGGMVQRGKEGRLALLHEMRVPGGETMHDRELRLAKMARDKIS